MPRKTSEVPCYLVVDYQEDFDNHTEECHGIHDFSGYIRDIVRVRVVINDEVVDVTSMLTNSMSNYLLDEVENNEL